MAVMPNLIEFGSRDAASVAAANFVTETLGTHLLQNPSASLMVSGGTTPTQMFELLSGAFVEWAAVTIGLVDERWVEPTDAASNERLVRAHLLKGLAGAANFIPMKTNAQTPKAAEVDRDQVYAPHCQPATVLVLGMGADGHTASWFPGSGDLADIVSASQTRYVVAVDAPGADVPSRMTLTGAAVFRAQHVLLLVFGEEKRDLLLKLETLEPMDCPIRFAIDGLGDRLTIHWAP